jgi:hypothetical protein
MHGYCGRAPAAGGADAAAAGIATDAAGARAYAVRQAEPLDGRRHLVVRIAPRPAGAAGAGRLAPPAGGEGFRQTQSRAA